MYPEPRVCYPSIIVHKNIMVSAATDRCLIFWNIADNFQPFAKVKLRGTGNVFSMALVDGEYLVLGCQDTNIRRTSIKSLLERLGTSSGTTATTKDGGTGPAELEFMELSWDLFTDHIGYVYSLCVSGDRLFSGSGDRYACIYSIGILGVFIVIPYILYWDTGGVCKAELIRVYMCVCPNIKCISTIGVWEMKTSSKMVKQLTGHTAPVNCLLSTERLLFSCSQDYTIRTWDIDTLGL